VILREARPDVALYDEAILELNRRYTGLAREVVEQGIAEGALRPDLVPSVIRDLIYGGIEHAVWRFTFSDKELDTAALEDQLADALLAGIVVRTAPETEPTLSRLERAVARLEAQIDG
jgi:hypothetical protein